MEDVDKHILVRGLGLSAQGNLDKETVRIAAHLDVPHHVGAGGVEDFVDKESFQRHVKRATKIREKEDKQLSLFHKTWQKDYISHLKYKYALK